MKVHIMLHTILEGLDKWYPSPRRELCFIVTNMLQQQFRLQEEYTMNAY